MTHPVLRFGLPLVFAVALADLPAHALNVAAHRIINEQATRRSTLNTVLKEQLGFADGIREVFQGLDVVRWIGEGGVREDDGSLFLGTARFLRHFHDPLKPRAQAGLSTGGTSWLSPVLWMQRLSQRCEAASTDNWSWQDARRCYALALTAPTPRAREQAWADTFRALGQLMHLVVDASVPEHVRNDMHPLGPVYGNYEYWVQTQHGAAGSPLEGQFIRLYFRNPVGLDPVILRRPTNDPAAPVPIAWLLDNDIYAGTDPNVTLTPLAGIAEFTNANFFSEDTTEREYPFPSVSRLVPSRYPAPRSGRTRAYFAKGTGDGLPVDPVLAECVLEEAARRSGASAQTVRCVDENVWTQTAAAMLPRAAGYAAGLLDYFFRGKLGGRVEQGSGGRTLRIRNLTPGGAMRGDIALYYDMANGTRVEQVRWTDVTLPPGYEIPGLAVPPPAPDRQPADANRYLLVFVGQLGGEPGNAVAARWIRTTPVILVGFVHEGIWASGWPLSNWGRYYEWDPGTVQVMEQHQGEPNFYRLEQIGVDLYSALVPQNPDAPIEFRRVPWEFIAPFETIPAPVSGYAAGPRWFVNYEYPPGAGVSVLDTDASWRVTVNWADSVSLDPRAPAILGEDTSGNVDVSPRVVRVCPGLDLTAGLFAPLELTHPWLGHCPDWYVFGD